MRLLEAIIEANHLPHAGRKTPEVHSEEFASELPLVTLTCIDPRLNRLIPEVLGLPEDKFIWLRNSGNIIFDPLSSMTRTLAVACAIKQGREIAIIGHTDCLVGKTSTLDLTERFRQLGVDRAKLPENLNEFFGLFASERQNVINSCRIVRSSPLIGPRIPVHGLVVDVVTGRLEWIINGYEELERSISAPATAISATAPAAAASHPENDRQDAIGGNQAFDVRVPIPTFSTAEMKFPDFKIGQTDISIGSISTKLPDVKTPESSFTPPSTLGVTSPPATLGEKQSQDTIGSFATKVENTKEMWREIKAAKTPFNRAEKVVEAVAQVTGSEKVAQLAGNMDLLGRLSAAIGRDMQFTIIGHDQKRYGPVSGEKLIKWLAEGRIDHNTPVQLEGATNWQPISFLAQMLEQKSIPLPPKWKWGSPKK